MVGEMSPFLLKVGKTSLSSLLDRYFKSASSVFGNT